MYVRLETILRATVKDSEGTIHARCEHDHETLTDAYDCGTMLLARLTDHMVQDGGDR